VDALAAGICLVLLMNPVVIYFTMVMGKKVKN